MDSIYTEEFAFRDKKGYKLEIKRATENRFSQASDKARNGVSVPVK